MLLNRAIWTFGGYGFSMAARLGTNIILSRLLVPEILGIMVIISSVRAGFELLTDVGIEQNIVQNEKGLEPAFFNTAWTLQIIRGAGLTAISLCLSPLLASLYGIDLRVFIFISFAAVLNSGASTSIFALAKKLEVRKRNVFEMTADLSNSLIFVTLAFLSPTVWAIVAGVLVSIGTRAALTYSIPHIPHRLTLNRGHVREILQFGKWITVSSFLIYATSNCDRIYLGKTVPLGVLGIYGLARTISELPLTLTGRLTYQIVFPLFAGMRARSKDMIRREVAGTRFMFILIASIVMATCVAWADWEIRILYDRRYDQAGWMLFMLLIGGWPAILSGLNDAVLLGFGHPAYGSAGNTAKLVALLVGLPCGFLLFGLPGAIAATGSSEVLKYCVLAAGQRRIQFSFLKQDAAGTGLLLLLLIAWVTIRASLHLGVPWAGVGG